MKRVGRVEGRSPFWSRLLGLLITFAIIAVLVFGGVKNLMSELSAANEALAASQYELGKTQNELASAQSELAASQSELSNVKTAAGDLARAVGQSQHQIARAKTRIVALHRAQNELKHRWANSMRALAQRNEQYLAADQALQATKAELERLRNQPQWSLIVTSERQMRQSYRERVAMSQARMFVEGDGGALYYEGMAAEREVEQYFSYGERTQVVLTTTAPGRDVLTCLNNPSLGCGAVVAAGYQAAQMQAYSYESQFSSAEMMLTEGRRGRRPGWRR